MASMAEVLEEVREIAGEAVLELRRARKDRERTPEVEAELLARREPMRPIDYTTALLQRAPGYAKLFEREVPAEFWTQVAAGAVDVACPCGETPTALYGIPQTCECGRAFLFTGKRVMVAFTPSGETEAAPVD